MQNRPFDLLRPPIDLKFDGESHGSNQNTQNTHQTLKNEEKHEFVPAPKSAYVKYLIWGRFGITLGSIRGCFGVDLGSNEGQIEGDIRSYSL